MTTVGYITEDEAVAHVHKIALDKGAPFDAADEALVKKACDHAFKRIRAILIERGVAASDVARWEDGADTQLKLTAHYAMKDLFIAKGREVPAWLEAFNVEAEIREGTILASDGIILARGVKSQAPGRLHGIDLEQMMDDAETQEE